MEVPPLTLEPKHHPDCCLSLSTKLLEALAVLLQDSRCVFSVGSGSGLLEACLQNYLCDSTVEGVETSYATNKYLPEQAVYIAKGTWEIHSRSRTADAWMFVYPRDPKLFAGYLETAEKGAVRLVLWLGPKSDWNEFGACLDRFSVRGMDYGEGRGVAEYELLVMIRFQ